MEKRFVCKPPISCFDCPKPDCNYAGSATSAENEYNRCGRKIKSGADGGIKWVWLEVSGYDMSLQRLQ